MDKFNLHYSEWASLGKGALMAGAGAALTYLTQYVSAADFGVYGPAVVAIFSVLANYVHKVTVPAK